MDTTHLETSLASYVGMFSQTLQGTNTEKNQAIISTFLKVINNLMIAEDVQKDVAIKPIIVLVLEYLVDYYNLIAKYCKANQDVDTAIKVLNTISNRK